MLCSGVFCWSVCYDTRVALEVALLLFLSFFSLDEATMLLRLRLKLICKMWLVKLSVYMWGKVTRLCRGVDEVTAKVALNPGTLAKIATFA